MFTNGTTAEELRTMEAIQSIAGSIDNLDIRLSSFPNRRDLFAAAALQGIMGTPWGMEASNENIAKSCFNIADAMIEARKEKNNG